MSGMKTALYGDVVDHADVQLNLFPPREETQVLRQQIDAFARLADMKKESLDQDFSLRKQRMLDTEKKKIKDIVSKGLSHLPQSWMCHV